MGLTVGGDLECLEDAREISSRYIEVVMTLYLSTHQPAGKFFSLQI